MSEDVVWSSLSSLQLLLMAVLQSFWWKLNLLISGIFLTKRQQQTLQAQKVCATRIFLYKPGWIYPCGQMLQKSCLPIELMFGSLTVSCQSPILSICTNLINPSVGSKVVLIRRNSTCNEMSYILKNSSILPFACTHHNTLQAVTTNSTLDYLF